MKIHPDLHSVIQQNLPTNWEENPIFKEFIASIYHDFSLSNNPNNHEIKDMFTCLDNFVLNCSNDAIVIVNDKGQIVFWHENATNLFGIGAPTDLSTSIYQFMSDEEKLKLKAILDDQSEHKKNQCLVSFTIQQQIVPCELSLYTSLKNNELYTCLMIRNISERLISENEIKKQEEKYRNILANMNLGLLEVDANETILYANQSFSQMAGLDIQKIIGRSAPDVIQFDHTDWKIVENKRTLRQNGVSDMYEVQYLNAKGQRRWWLISGAPNFNDKGEFTGSIGIHLDITDQKKLEFDLAKAKDKAEEASKAKEAFLANMSHEIRTPLNAIIGMIREMGRESLPSKIQNYLSNSESAARHLLSIINNILDISKIEAGEFLLELKDFSLHATINNVNSILHTKAMEKELSLEFNISDEVAPALLGDQGRILQILLNLIGNAIKFTELGAVTVKVRVAEDAIDHQLIHFEIIDTGIGMSQDFLQNVFKKFTQENYSLVRKYEGTGLGMAITKELIQLMGGICNVKSKQNEGTIIDFTIQFAKGNIQNLIKEQNQHIEKSFEGMTVFLVEDNDMNRFIAKKCLNHFGMVVFEATNGKEAIEFLKHQSADVILMDIQMPEMDGIEATKYIRQELHNQTPIIALTANAFKNDIDTYLNIGMNDYVTKPFEESTLYNTLYRQLPKIITHPIMEDTNAATNNLLYDTSFLMDTSQGDTQFVKEMLQLFNDMMPATLTAMNAALEEKNYMALSKLAHKIKPNIDNLGINVLKQEIRTLEVEAKESTVDIPRVKELTAHVIAVLEQTMAQIKDHLTKAS